MSSEALPLLPTPADIRLDGGQWLTLDAALPIAMSGSQSTFAARELQAAVFDATGLRPSLLAGRVHDGERRIVLELDDEARGSEAYTLRIEASGATISASADAGLFYGVQTFKQLVRLQGGRLRPLTIEDRPALAHRGVMLDVSRGKVPTLATLYALVDRLAEYKYNQLQLYVEHTFDFASHPSIGAGVEPLTADDILALDQYCRQRYVELVPNLQSFGHHRHLLSLPEYADLDEVGWRWSLSPAREETYQLLADLYADYLPNFSSRCFNVDCDETWDLGTGQSKLLAGEIGKSRLYLQHILRVRQLAAVHGRRIMLWADVLHHYPELVSTSDLPEDVLLLDWQYEASEGYPSVEALGQSGRSFWVCPGTSTWNTLFPRLDNALGNIQGFTRAGIAAGASGMLLTDWGDYGHYQPLALSWYPYAFGAATAWSGARTSPEEFDAAFAAVCVSSEPAVRAMRRLGRAVSQPTLGVPNGSRSALALFDDPLAAPLTTGVDSAELEELRSAAEEAVGAWATLADRTFRHDYGFTARLVAFAAEKTLLSHRVRSTLQSPRPTPARLDGDVAALESHRARLSALRDEFETCWLRHARRSEIGLTLDQFASVERAYAEAIHWLTKQRTALAAGVPVDANLRSYTPPRRPVLWEQGQRDVERLRELGGEV